MSRDKRNKGSELFFRQTHEICGCFQFLVFNIKLGLSKTIKCDPVFRMCVNDPLSQLRSTKIRVRAYQPPY
jgi:hypothetical protein